MDSSLPSSTTSTLRTIAVSATTAVVVTGAMLFAVPGNLQGSLLGDQQALPPQTSNPAVLTTAPSDSETGEPISALADKVGVSVASVIVEREFGQQAADSRFHDPFFEQFFDFPIPRRQQSLPDGQTQRRQVGAGTAFVVHSNGREALLMTNKHVADAADDEKTNYEIVFADGRSFPGTVIARDPTNDLALVKITGTNLPPALPFAESVRVGQMAITIGYALGEFTNSLTVGYVSGLARTIVAGGLLDGRTEQLTRIIQTDAAINPGNSGGPLLNRNGEVMGVNVAMANAQSIGFTIHVDDARSALVSYLKNGRIARPYLGVRYATVTSEMQTEQRLPVLEGVVIIGGDDGEPAVVSGSPAEKAGLKEGMIILEVDGVRLKGPDASLAGIIQRKLPGDQARLKIWDNGREREMIVTLEELHQ